MRGLASVAHENPSKPVPSSTPPPASDDESETLEQLARKPEAGLFREFIAFLREYRAWWLVPILVSLALLAALLFLGGTGAAPFIYSLF